jgi:hypothetical protein
MTQVSLKNVQLALQKITTWMKKSGKGHQEWDKACRVVGLALRKLKTLVKRKVVNKIMFFLETLKFVNAINICYQR